MPHAGTSLIDPYVVFKHAGLAEGMRVADLGCGRTGHFVFPSSRAVGERGLVYAVDIMKDILENIKSRARSEAYHNVQTVWSNIELPGKTAIPDNSLDGCFIVNVLWQLPKKEGAVAEALRLLKPGGFLAIVEWVKNLGPVGPSAGRALTPEMVKQAVGPGLGARLVEQFPLGDYHFCSILRKNSDD